MTTTPSRTYDRYALGAAQSYERDFVPAIGLPFARRILDAARLTPGERVIDVACGTGVVARLAAEAVGAGGRVAGLDGNPAMLQVARTHSPEGIDWHEAPAERMPVPDESFDAVLCSLGLMFFGDKPAALREMRRVLAPGGRVVIGTPGPTPPQLAAIGQALAAHAGPAASAFVHAVFSFHDPAEARRLLHEAGFAAIDVATGSVPVRLAPPVEFLWQYVHSTPLVAVLADLDQPTRDALERDVAERCRPFVDGDGMVMEPGLLLATARRPDAGTG